MTGTSFENTIPTVTDNAWNDGLLDNYEVGISFEPVTSSSSTNGLLTFGGVDASRFTGTITYTWANFLCLVAAEFTIVRIQANHFHVSSE